MKTKLLGWIAGILTVSSLFGNVYPLTYWNDACHYWNQSVTDASARVDVVSDGKINILDAVQISVNSRFTDSIVGTLTGVPAGIFTQGSPLDESCREPWNTGSEAQFTHTLTRDMLVMETEVSRQMWADLKAVQSSLPVDPTLLAYGSGMNNPVQNNTWYEAVLFANLLSLEHVLTCCYYKDASFTIPVDSSNYASDDIYCNFDANGYRLPSEGEWEYFTRAGTTEPFSIDEPNYNVSHCGCAISLANLETVATFCGNDSDRTEQVGSKDANPWGVKDVHGNVWEWCWDWYSSSYPAGSETNYTGVTSGSDHRAGRGGSWGSNARDCRSASRSWGTPSGGSSLLGFRLVRTYP